MTSSPTSPRTVIFDLFGVIAREQTEQGRAMVFEASAGSDLAAFLAAYWDCRPGYDAGELDGPAYWRMVGRRLGEHYGDARIGTLIRADLASWDAVDDQMTAILARLDADGHTLALLSHLPHELAAAYETRTWMRHFDFVAFSCRIGLIKPDPRAYQWCVDRLGGDPSVIRFVDDREENVAAAGQVGLKAYQFEGHEALAGVLGAE